MMLYTSLQRDPPKKYQPLKGCKERQYFPSIAQFYCLQGHAIPTRGFFKFYNPPDQTVKWLLSVRKTPLCSRVAPSSFFFYSFLGNCANRRLFLSSRYKKKEGKKCTRSRGFFDSLISTRAQTDKKRELSFLFLFFFFYRESISRYSSSLRILCNLLLDSICIPVDSSF